MIRLSSQEFWRTIALPCLVYTVIFFGGSEIVEYLFLNRVDEATLHALHFLRGAFSVFFVAGMIFFFLYRAEQRFDHRMEAICSLLNAANEGFIAFDSNWNLVSMNPKAKDMVGPASSEFDRWKEVVRLQLTKQTRLEIMNPEGDRKIRVTALQSHQRGLLLLLHDITEEKKFEEQWLIAEKMASVGRMAAGLAHEIGTPLNIISGRAELIQGAEASACENCSQHASCRVQKHIGIIFAQIERISEIIRQLLTQAREPVSQQEFFLLNDCVVAVSEFLQPVLEKKKIKLLLDLDENLPKIFGFRDQFQQVLINLMTNSMDAMEGRHGSIRISTGIPNGELLLKMTDEGCGISEVNLTKIFDPFFTTKEFGKGTGLGLTVTSNIIRSHGGSIDVQSKPSRGTEISIHLPVHHTGTTITTPAWRQ